MNESACQVIAELYPIHGPELWKFVQWLDRTDRQWKACGSSHDLDINDGFLYRAKPRTHIVNGIECPAPMRQQPKDGTRVYYINSACPSGLSTMEWQEDNPTCYRIFTVGCWDNEREALQNFAAHFPHMREGAGDE